MAAMANSWEGSLALEKTKWDGRPFASPWLTTNPPVAWQSLMIGVVMAELITHGRAAGVDSTPLRWSRVREGQLLTSRHGYRVLA